MGDDFFPTQAATAFLEVLVSYDLVVSTVAFAVNAKNTDKIAPNDRALPECTSQRDRGIRDAQQASTHDPAACE